MRQQHTLKISEIFASVQGEGLRLGEATLFIRLSGCNLQCPFCDTQYAWERGEQMPIDHILDRIKQLRKRFATEWVCLTGGEPLIQDVENLALRLKVERLKIQIETNGTIYRTLPVDWYTISPKPEKYQFQPEYKTKAREVKLVVVKDLDFGIVQKIREAFPPKIPLLLQPESNLEWSMLKAYDLLKRAVNTGMKNIRLSLQLHKVFRLQ
jgi:organic radical activating enzyme